MSVWLAESSCFCVFVDDPYSPSTISYGLIILSYGLWYQVQQLYDYLNVFVNDEGNLDKLQSIPKWTIRKRNMYPVTILRNELQEFC